MIGLPSLQLLSGVLRERGFALLLTLQAFFGSLQLLDALRVKYYPMIHRSTKLVYFDLGVSLALPLAVLLLCWLWWMNRRQGIKSLVFPMSALLVYPFLSLAGGIAVASLLATIGGLWYDRDFGGFFFWGFLLLSLVEGLALLHWLVFVPMGWASPVEGVALLETGLFYISGYLAPLLVLPFLFMWALRPLVSWLWHVESNSRMIARSEMRISKRAFLFLVFSLLIGVLAALYPHISTINPKEVAVGVDYVSYVEHAELVEHNISRSMEMMGGTRTPIFLLIFYIQKFFGSDASFTVKFLPVLLNPLLVVSVYFLASELFRDSWAAAWAAFFTASGIQVTVGMYTYFLTNLLGLIFILFSLGLLFKALRLGCWRYLVFSCLAGGLLAFTHPWSFVQYFAVTVFSLGVLWYAARNNECSTNFRMIFVYLAALAISDVLKTTFFEYYIGRGVGGVYAASTAVKMISGLSEFWYSSIFSFRLLFGGTLSSVALFSLSAVGISLLGLYSYSEAFFVSIPFVSSILFLIGDETIKSRILFNIPFGLYAACGFLWLLKQEGVEKFNSVLTSFIFLSMLVYLFRSLGNLV